MASSRRCPRVKQNYTYDGLDRLATRNSAPFTYAGLEKEPATD
ncbi:hypothetical protein Ga0074812_1679, partial [Parafrankia irregularis]